MDFDRSTDSVRPSPGAVQAAWCATLVDEWVRCGVRYAVLCPGSRSTPLALALVGHGEIAVRVHLDERSAGFVALGIALASRTPVVLCTTSGTATAELHPAVVEASYARVPLVVCSADRPRRLHGVGAAQTIDQEGLYGSAVRWMAAPGLAQWGERWTWRSIASRAVAEACDGPFGPGPVHLNLEFDEPLLAEGPIPTVPAGRGEGKPWHEVFGSSRNVNSKTTAERDLTLRQKLFPHEDADLGQLGADRLISELTSRGLDAALRGVVVAGAGSGDAEALFALASSFGWPVLADPRSGLRISLDTGEKGSPVVVTAVDAMLRDDDVARALRPDFVLRLGSPWASRVVGSWLDSLADEGVPQVVVDPWWRWQDPGRRACFMVSCDPSALCQWLVRATAGQESPSEWRLRWSSAEAAAQEAIDHWCAQREAGGEGLCEPTLARSILRLTPALVPIVVASSMPIRDVEWYGGAHEEPRAVVANRGANGIDGVVSTAVGVAAGAGRSVALVGDLAFLHDLTALVRPANADVPCAIVVADNAGGGIFSFLPQKRIVDEQAFEVLFGTPQAVDVAQVARGLGVPVHDVGTERDLKMALSEALAEDAITVVRARVPSRTQNVALHEELDSHIATSVKKVLLGRARSQG